MDKKKVIDLVNSTRGVHVEIKGEDYEIVGLAENSTGIIGVTVKSIEDLGGYGNYEEQIEDIAFEELEGCKFFVGRKELVEVQV